CIIFKEKIGIRDDLVTGVQTCALPISQPYRSLKTSGIIRCRKGERAVGSRASTARKNFRSSSSVSILGTKVDRFRVANVKSGTYAEWPSRNKKRENCRVTVILCWWVAALSWAFFANHFRATEPGNSWIVSPSCTKKSSRRRKIRVAS